MGARFEPYPFLVFSGFIASATSKHKLALINNMHCPTNYFILLMTTTLGYPIHRKTKTAFNNLIKTTGSKYPEIYFS
jgi:hypothetical protein